MLLADLGAEVIKIERPPSGDSARNWPFFGQSIFLSLNRNKKSIALNLTKESGQEVFRKLVRKADVLVENLAPGVADKLGASYNVVNSLNKNIIYCSLSGYGKNNPYSSLPAWDPVIQAMSGLMSVTGEKNGAPVRIGTSVVDMGAGLFACLGIMSTLLSRRSWKREKKKEKETKKEEGMMLDVSLLDCATTWMSFWITYYSLYHKLPEKTGSAWPAFAPYQVFPAKNGHVFIGVSNEDYWKRLCQALKLEDSEVQMYSTNEKRISNFERVVKLIEKATIAYERDELVSILRKFEIPCAPVNNISDVINDPALLQRKIIKRIKDQRLGDFCLVLNPLGPSSIGQSSIRVPPEVGRDSYQILLSLGYKRKDAMQIISENSN
jgi:crotonobetainyl-CoA:carnitine CoA-transferase CaiB-like acyl-CoA transferase